MLRRFFYLLGLANKKFNDLQANSEVSVVAILLFLVIYLASCSPPCGGAVPEYVSKDTTGIDYLNSGEDCALPCWNGIQPGETDASNAVAILQDSSFVRDDSISREPNYGFPNTENIIWKTALTDTTRNTGRIRVNADDIVTEINVALEHKLSTDEAFNILGTPDYFGIISTQPECYTVSLFWLGEGISVDLHSVRALSDEVLINSEILITNIHFFPPTSSLEDYFTNSLFYSSSEASAAVSEGFAAWNGYDSVRFSAVYDIDKD